MNQVAETTVPMISPSVDDAGTAELAREQDLVRRLRDGDEEASEQLVRQHGGAMLQVLRRLLRCEDDAHDALQEAFLAAFRSIALFQGTARLGTWLHRIAVNAALMKLRRASRRNEVSIEELLPRWSDDGHHAEPVAEWSQSADATAMTGETRARVRACIDQLPDTWRTVLVLRDIEELSTAEAADLLHISENAVKIRLHRARQALRTLISPMFEEL